MAVRVTPQARAVEQKGGEPVARARRVQGLTGSQSHAWGSEGTDRFKCKAYCSQAHEQRMVLRYLRLQGCAARGGGAESSCLWRLVDSDHDPRLLGPPRASGVSGR